MSDTFWLAPPEQSLALLSRLLAAHDIPQLWAEAAPACEARTQLLEARLAAKLDAMGELGAQMRQDMRPGLLDRLRDLWHLLTGGMRSDDAADGGEADLFAFRMSLAETLPTGELPVSADALFAETGRLREAIGARITRERQAAPQQIRIPAAALAFMENPVWSADEEQLAEIATITAYWPPMAGKPALALAEQQQDAGLPVELRLLAHDAAGHAAFMAVIRQAGGAVQAQAA
ncbi:hypothetical protein [Azorhizobium oxalatiphilum]|uniref:hypothetical protein n=1 Tax=Azorhizobium oxalatiphilum TaxID=980631 RepID=UPI00166E8859|nr:hypothetical protein [Azorhizobium oxalatiphilum]